MRKRISGLMKEYIRLGYGEEIKGERGIFLCKVKQFHKSFIRIILILGLLWVCIALLLYFFQDKILYSTQTLSIETIQRVKKTVKNSQEIYLKSDNIRLHGWLVKNREKKQSPLIIYFGGQGDEISPIIEASEMFHGCDLLAYNYRGYGLSEGRPGEKSILEDSLAIYDNITARKDVNKEDIIVMGRSLGTGTAVYLAENRKAKALILVSPYDSITSVAQEKFPFIPIAMINHNQFDSLSRIPKINCPLLMIIGEKDLMIPPWHSLKVYKKYQGPKSLTIIKNKGHNDLMTDEVYWTAIQNFLGKI